MATIGVTRGLGDHNLRVCSSSLPIKPFLSCFPEVSPPYLPLSLPLLGSGWLWPRIPFPGSSLSTSFPTRCACMT